MGILRLLLALAVVLEHTAHHGFHLMRGYEAVHVFFIISGFYMCMILLEKYTVSRAGIRAFYLNRFLRLWPSYIAVVLCAIAWYLLCRYTTSGHMPANPLVALSATLELPLVMLLWIANIGLIGIDILNWFVVHSDGTLEWAKSGLDAQKSGDAIWLGYAKWVPQAWTIGSEIWFYLCAPFFLLFRKCVVVSIALGALVSFFAMVAFADGFMHRGYFIWVFWLWLFCLGMLVFIFYRNTKPWFDALPAKESLRWPIVWSILSVFVVPYLVGCKLSEATLVLVSLVAIPVLFHLTKQSKHDRFIGELSYPVYISHLLTEEVSQTIIGVSGVSWSWLVCINVTLTLAMSVLLVKLIDEPVEVLRRRIAARARS